MRYCPDCATPLAERVVAGQSRPACPSCRFVYFADPKLAVALLIEADGRLLLGRRGEGASAPGKWSFPAGFVDRGEVVEEAARREAREETGLDVRLEALIGLYSTPGDAVVLAVYAASIAGGIMAAADDLLELAFYAPTDLPEPAFAHDPYIVSDWLAWRAGRPPAPRTGRG